VVEFVTGNLLEADAEALVNTVNTKGVMGKGVALQFKRAFPENYQAYRAACAAGRVQLGRMFVFDSGRMERPRYIINFPTKDHWRSRSRLADIDAGLEDLRRVLAELKIESVALPPLGCGLGGLRWADVRPRIERALGTVPVRVLVFEPHGAPAPEEMPERRARPRMTAFRATLVWLLSRYLAPGETASPLEVQKLLYFLQEAGEPLGLEFEKQRYGPYADAARHAVIHIEGHYVTGFGDGTGPGDVRPLPGAVDEAETFLADHPRTRERYERVVELIDGFETPYGLELLATTHWVATHEDAGGPAAAADRVRAWSQRKHHLFTDEHVTVAWKRLEEGGWLLGARVPAGA
jgi:O-acetyl-ADP-ribose deacetylase (regulator of RNase III)